MKVEVQITFKDGILDPQGKVIKHSLHSLGFSSIKEVKISKNIILELEETNSQKAQSQVKSMCEKLLANTVIEDYKIKLA